MTFDIVFYTLQQQGQFNPFLRNIISRVLCLKMFCPALMGLVNLQQTFSQLSFSITAIKIISVATLTITMVYITATCNVLFMYKLYDCMRH